MAPVTITGGRGGSLPPPSPAPFDLEASSSTVLATPDERERGRRRRAQSLPVDVERHIGGGTDFLVRPEVSRVSLFPPLNMRAVSRNYHPPTPPKVKTYDRPTASFAAMCGAATTKNNVEAKAMMGKKEEEKRQQHALDVLAADIDPTEREGIDPEDMYTHVDRWLPRDLAPAPRYVPPTPPPATVLRRRATLLTPEGHRNLGAEDPTVDVTPRGLHLDHHQLREGDDGDDDDDDDDESDCGDYHENDDDVRKLSHQREEEEEERESREAGVSSEGDETAAATTSAAAAAAGNENENGPVVPEQREYVMSSSSSSSSSSRGVLRALDENVVDDVGGGVGGTGVGETGEKKQKNLTMVTMRTKQRCRSDVYHDARPGGVKVVNGGLVSVGAGKGDVRASRGGGSFRRWRKEQFDAGVVPAERALSVNWKR